MLLTDFGTRSGFSIPRANIGAMRLPKDSDEAVALIRHAIDSGMKYIDTSRGYGESEIKLGRALKDGYRDKVILSTKWSPWITKIDPGDDSSADCVVRRIEESMARLDVDYLDFYQVWNIQNRDQYQQTIRKGGFLDGIMKAKSRGLIGHTGFTSHDSVENLLDYIDEADWCEVLLVSYNIIDTTYEPVLRKAKEKGIGTIVMNPMGGGKLATAGSVFDALARESGCVDLPDLALRFIMANPDVDTVISGISKASDVDRTVAAVNSRAFTEREYAAIRAFVGARSSKNMGFCTSCDYCMPCPNDVHIPRIMKAIFQQRFLGFEREGAALYNSIGDKWVKHRNASACNECGLCVSKCTQKLDIPAEMAYARATWPNPPVHDAAK
jgi:hypothetical protein